MLPGVAYEPEPHAMFSPTISPLPLRYPRRLTRSITDAPLGESWAKKPCVPIALECASESAVFSWSKRERTGGPLRGLDFSSR